MEVKTQKRGHSLVFYVFFQEIYSKTYLEEENDYV